MARLDDAARAAGVPLAAAGALFVDGDALAAAVAEQAIVQLTDHLTRCTTSVALDDPVGQYKALSGGFISWVLRNPVSTGMLTQRWLASQPGLQQVQRYDRAIHDLARNLLQQAQAAGMMADTATVEGTLFYGRALTLGLARSILGVSPASQPGMSTTIEQACTDTLAHFYASVFRTPPATADDQPIRSEA